MPATTIKIADYIVNAINGPIDGNSNSFRIALSNTAPGSETTNPTLPGNGVLANVTQISYTNYGDTLSTDRTLQSVTSTLSGTTYVFDAPDFTIQPSGGSLASFRYIYIFDDTPTSPADPLVLCIDLGEVVTLASGEPYVISFNTSGIIRIA